MLAHESPLTGYHPAIGGSAGRGTHGGQRVERPAAMPTRDDATHVVSTRSELLDAVITDNAVIYVEDDIDVTGVDGHWIGDDITLIGGFCDPNIPGRGPVIHSDEPSKYVFKSAYGHAPTLWGISAKGPETAYQDPDHTAADFSETFASFLFSYDDAGTFKIYGCEFFGWTLAGILCGAKNHETTTDVDRSSFHHNRMEHLGYGIEHYNGFLSIDRCFFDKCRHGISSFGYPTGGWAAAHSVFGPDACGHSADMHCLANNLSTDDRTAGEFVRVWKCTFMATLDRAGYPQEGVAIRGEPVKTSYVDKSHFCHDHEPAATGGQGDAYRQETGWHDPPDEWLNFEPRDNVFGPEQSATTLETYGAPRAEKPELPKPMNTLTIHGHRVPAQYRITIKGDATVTAEGESNERVIEHDDGTVTVAGFVNKWTDTFEVSDDAIPIAATIEGPITVMHNGNQVDVGMLASIDDGDGTADVSELRDRVSTIEATLAAIRQVFSK